MVEANLLFSCRKNAQFGTIEMVMNAGKRGTFSGQADRLVTRMGAYLATDAGMKRFGLSNAMRLGRLYNRIRYRHRWNLHLDAYRGELANLLQENGGDATFPPKLRMKDGWALDSSHSLPHLDRLIAEAGEIIRQRGGREHSDTQYPFLRSLLFPGDLKKYPAFLDFVTSTELLATVIDYLGTIPVLSKVRPPGVRFMESNVRLDPDSHLPPRDSQLYHIDFYDSPQVYVLVLMEDVTSESGPWTFLPASTTDRVAEKIGYRGLGYGYRVQDKEIYRHVDKSEEIVFAHPKGTVLFIDSSRCFHFGSRDAVKPRFMVMYGLQSPCRRDFAYAYMRHEEFPIPENASRLRKLVLGNLDAG